MGESNGRILLRKQVLTRIGGAEVNSNNDIGSVHGTSLDPANLVCGGA